jgi:tripartite-type tricarboxylate transporter receptor subunit TctC
MRKTWCAALGFIAFGATGSAFGAQSADSFPSRSIRLVVPFPPGGLSDGLARIICQALTQQWGQPVVVDNRPGAGTTLAAEIVAKSPADGYTLLFQDITTHGINAGLYRKLPYDARNDFSAVAFASESPLVLTVHPSLPVHSTGELVALARARPRQINYGSSGNGAVLHLAGELFKKLAHVDLVHVPYKGSPPAVTALVSGEVAVVFATTGSVIPHMHAGKVRALAVTTSRRSPLLPELPPLNDSIAGYDLILYQGILAPAKAPREVVTKLNAEINSIMSRTASRDQWRRLGAEPVIISVDDAARRFAEEISKLSRMAVETGAKID